MKWRRRFEPHPLLSAVFAVGINGGGVTAAVILRHRPRRKLSGVHRLLTCAARLVTAHVGARRAFVFPTWVSD